jgi:hypothetical protein
VTGGSDARLAEWYAQRAKALGQRAFEVEGALEVVIKVRAGTLLVGPVASRLAHEHVALVRRSASTAERLKDTARWFLHQAQPGNEPNRPLQRSVWASENAYRETSLSRQAALAYRGEGTKADLSELEMVQPPDPAQVRQVDEDKVKHFAQVLDAQAQRLQTTLQVCSRLKVDVPPFVPARDRQLHTIRVEAIRRALLAAIPGFRRTAADLRRRAARLAAADAVHYDPGQPGAGILDEAAMEALAVEKEGVELDVAALAAGIRGVERWGLIVVARLERLQRVWPILMGDAASGVAAAIAGRPWPAITPASEERYWKQRLAGGPYDVPAGVADVVRIPDPITGEMIGEREHWRRYGRPAMPLEDFQRLHDRLGGGPYEPAAGTTFPEGDTEVDPLTGESISAEERFRRYGPEDPEPQPDLDVDGDGDVDEDDWTPSGDDGSDDIGDGSLDDGAWADDTSTSSGYDAGLLTASGDGLGGDAAGYDDGAWATDDTGGIDAGDGWLPGDDEAAGAEGATAGDAELEEAELAAERGGGGGFEVPWQVLAAAGAVGAVGTGVGLRVHRQRAARQVRDWVTYKELRAREMAASGSSGATDGTDCDG